nr:MAG TPA: hypothetical protein [Caudoviricetes sp.]
MRGIKKIGRTLIKRFSLFFLFYINNNNSNIAFWFIFCVESDSRSYSCISMINFTIFL